jgi:hypothetical protein
MQYALLIYGTPSNQSVERPIEDDVAAVLARPCVSGWLRLHADESATTVRSGSHEQLLTDGPFVESKEFLAGLILVEATDLDGALEIAQELQQTRTALAIEVRPAREWLFRGA